MRALARSGAVRCPAHAHGRLSDRVATGQGSRRRCPHQGHDPRSLGLSRMSSPQIDRQTMDVDIVCVGFGPATAGFLTTLSRHLVNPDGTPAIESPSNPGLPLQVMCYERADDVSFGVSGVVTRARGIRASMPDLDASQIPMAVTVKQEKVAYLLDPNDASRRSATVAFGDGLIRSLGMAKDPAVELPYIPPFLHKDGGLVMSLGQFLQHIGTEPSLAMLSAKKGDNSN